MKKILLAQKIPEEVVSPLRQEFQIDLSPSPDDETIRSIIGDYDGLLVRTATKLSRDTIFAAEKLKVIGRTGIGVDNIDIEAASLRNIPVCNTPDANSISVAEHTLAFIFALTKDLVGLNKSTKAGDWGQRDLTQAVDLSGKTIGLLGFGRIGHRISEMLQLIGMQIAVFDPYIKAEALPKNFMLYRDLQEFVKDLDILSIHAPLTPETKGIVNYELLDIMKSDAYIINTSRGPLLDEVGLVRHLTAGKFAGVGLDVFEKEPLSPENPLCSFERVIMTPHSAALTRECRVRMADHAMQGIADILRGKAPKWVFNSSDIDYTKLFIK